MSQKPDGITRHDVLALLGGDLHVVFARARVGIGDEAASVPIIAIFASTGTTAGPAASSSSATVVASVAAARPGCVSIPTIYASITARCLTRIKVVLTAAVLSGAPPTRASIR